VCTGDLLVHDWAPNDNGDKILYVFDCGDLGADESRIRLQSEELDQWAWVPIDKLDSYVISRLVRRIRQAYNALREGKTRYLEHGEPALPSGG
jgi:8-oxo-dGTP diphosphatase